MQQRKSIRLKKYDYSQEGYYFVTICIQNRGHLFGEIIDDQMKLNAAGKMIDHQWNRLISRFNTIQLDQYIVMPNHFHGIIIITPTSAPTRDASPVGKIIGVFKSITTYEYIHGVKNHNWASFDKKFWQRNYYEHTIRNEASLYKIRDYINNNPINWHKDKMNQST